jgi:DNA-binding MarR family transcriptional regulator
MFAETLTAAIASASLNQLDHMAQTVWRAHGAGHIDDDQAQDLAERIQQRRPAVARALNATGCVMTAATRNRIQRSPEQRSPDRRASIARRRRLAATGMLPPGLAEGFTFCEQAVLAVIAAEWLAHGVCDRSRNELASRAGMSVSQVKRAIKQAENEGLISVQRRPRSGRKHLTNIIRIIRAEWVDWLKKGNRKPYAVKACTRAKPDFARGFKVEPPRSQVLQKRIQRRVGNSVKKTE